MTASEYAKRVGLGPRQIQLLCRQGKLPAQILPNRRGGYSWEIIGDPPCPRRPRRHLTAPRNDKRALLAGGRYAETPDEKLVMRLLDTIRSSGMREPGTGLNWELFRAAYQARDTIKETSADIVVGHIPTHVAPSREAWV